MIYVREKEPKGRETLYKVTENPLRPDTVEYIELDSNGTSFNVDSFVVQNGPAFAEQHEPASEQQYYDAIAQMMKRAEAFVTAHFLSFINKTNLNPKK